MKSRNGQSVKQQSFYVANFGNATPFNNESMLNEMYDRVRTKQVSGEPSEHNRPLLSYLAGSGMTSKVEEIECENQIVKEAKGQDVGDWREMKYRCERSKGKKMSLQERVKTDVNEQEMFVSEEVRGLLSENDSLKRRLLNYEKRMIALESVESEAEYLKKLVLLQTSEIERLRLLLKNSRFQQVQLQYSETEGFKSKSKSLKSTKCEKNYALANELSGEGIFQKKGKFREVRIGKQNEFNFKTEPAFFEGGKGSQGQGVRERNEKNKGKVGVEQKGKCKNNRKSTMRIN